MSIVELYSFLFLDSIISSLILLPNTNMVFDAMRIFGHDNFLLSVIFAVIGSSIGLSINYIFGKILNHVKKTQMGNSQKYNRLAKFSQTHLSCLGLFCFIPLIGVIIPCFLGMMRVSFSKCLLWIIIGRIIFYSTSFLI